MRSTAFSLVIAAMLTASPARATPPQVVSVKETLLSIGGGFLFVERELNDNMGSHFLQQTDVVLIARSIETNRDTYIWPLKRTLDKGPDHVETAANPRIVDMPLDQINTAGQIINHHHGRHPNQQKATNENAVRILANKDGVLISASTPTFAYAPPEGTPARTSYWVSYPRLTKVIEDSLRNTRYSFPPHFVEGTDILVNPNFNPEQDCTFSYFAELSEQTDGPQQGFWAAYVSCENDDTMAPVSMFITLQALP